jgi:hypothetical protein
MRKRLDRPQAGSQNRRPLGATAVATETAAQLTFSHLLSIGIGIANSRFYGQSERAWIDSNEGTPSILRLAR